MPCITGSIQRYPFNPSTLRNIKYLLEESTFADNLPKEIESSQIELLIGNDYYLDITLPHKIEITPGFYMLGSKLGWILTGRTSEAVDNTEEASLLMLTHGTAIKEAQHKRSISQKVTIESKESTRQNAQHHAIIQSTRAAKMTRVFVASAKMRRITTVFETNYMSNHQIYISPTQQHSKIQQ